MPIQNNITVCSDIFLFRETRRLVLVIVHFIYFFLGQLQNGPWPTDGLHRTEYNTRQPRIYVFNRCMQSAFQLNQEVFYFTTISYFNIFIIVYDLDFRARRSSKEFSVRFQDFTAGIAVFRTSRIIVAGIGLNGRFYPAHFP